MAVNESNISAFIKGAWNETLNRTEAYIPTGNRRKHHAAWSGIWVDCLGEAFRRHYEEENQLVFWRGNTCNREDFRLNELLFDISVCEMEEVRSIRRRVTLPFVARCYWQVESELDDEDSREITIDFSKLVMGRSENKLFVSSYLDKHRDAAQTLFSTMAPYCCGNLYLCFIPYPSDWDAKRGGPEPELLKWVDEDWEPCRRP